MTAVFKKWDEPSPSNCRPVSLTWFPCKTMEHVVFSQTMCHLDNYDILVHFQPNHSCETQLLTSVVDLSHRLDKRKTIDLLILDFSKAFDTVSHRRILFKLKHYDIVVTHRGDPAEWCAGSGGKYRELVLEGNQWRLKSGFRLRCIKRAGLNRNCGNSLSPLPSF